VTCTGFWHLHRRLQPGPHVHPGGAQPGAAVRPLLLRPGAGRAAAGGRVPVAGAQRALAGRRRARVPHHRWAGGAAAPGRSRLVRSTKRQRVAPSPGPSLRPATPLRRRQSRRQLPCVPEPGGGRRAAGARLLPLLRRPAAGSAVLGRHERRHAQVRATAGPTAASCQSAESPAAAATPTTPTTAGWPPSRWSPSWSWPRRRRRAPACGGLDPAAPPPLPAARPAGPGTWPPACARARACCSAAPEWRWGCCRPRCTCCCTRCCGRRCCRCW
jgi:hypothetical protein